MNKGDSNADRFWCEGRHLRWSSVLGAGISPFRLGGRSSQAKSRAQTGTSDDLCGSPVAPAASSPYRRVTAEIYRNGYVWNATAELPGPENFDNHDEYLACCIALLDLSVDKGVQAS